MQGQEILKQALLFQLLLICHNIRGHACISKLNLICSTDIIVLFLKEVAMMLRRLNFTAETGPTYSTKHRGGGGGMGLIMSLMPLCSLTILL